MSDSWQEYRLEDFGGEDAVPAAVRSHLSNMDSAMAKAGPVEQ